MDRKAASGRRSAKALLPGIGVALAICLLLSLGFRAEDGGDPFAHHHDESFVELTLDAWTRDLFSGESRSVEASLRWVGWEVWIRPDTGETELRNVFDLPLEEVEIAFSASGDGSVSPSSAFAGADGTAFAVFSADASLTGGTVHAAALGASA